MAAVITWFVATTIARLTFVGCAWGLGNHMDQVGTVVIVMMRKMPRQPEMPKLNHGKPWSVTCSTVIAI